MKEYPEKTLYFGDEDGKEEFMKRMTMKIQIGKKIQVKVAMKKKTLDAMQKLMKIKWRERKQKNGKRKQETDASFNHLIKTHNT